MATNGVAATKYACKCLNIRIHIQPTKDAPPPVEAGFKPAHVGEEGIRVAHTEVTLRSRSKPVPDPDSASGELTRYTTVTCLICGIPTYRVSQRITPDLINEVGPILPTDDWVEKDLVKSATGWVEVYQGCLTDDEISQAESSPMYSSMFSVVLPGPKPPAVQEDSSADIPNARGPSEQGKKHLPELPPLFLPPPFTPSHVVFSHFSALATQRSERLRDEAEEYIAQLTQQKVAEIRKAEAALKQEVNLLWSKFRDSIRVVEETGALNKAGLPLRRRGSVSGPARAVSSPTPGTSASVRISSFVPTPSPPPRHASGGRAPAPSALSASLKTSGFHYPNAQRQANGNPSPARHPIDLPPPSYVRASPTRSDRTRVDSPSTASTRTAAVSIDPEASIREAYRREIDEHKDIATSFRYVMNLEAQMEQQRLEEEAALASPSVASTSQVPAEKPAVQESRVRSPRLHKSAIKNAQPPEGSKPAKGEDGEKSKSKGAGETKEGIAKGKRKVTFDVQPEVAVIKDEGDAERPAPPVNHEDPIFDMDNETDQSPATRVEAPARQPEATPSTPERARPPPRQSHSRSARNSGLPLMLSSLRPASLPAPSAMRPPVRQPPSPVESSERTRALRESLLSTQANSSRPDVTESPIEMRPERSDDDAEADPREAEILRLVAASTPSHRSAWKKNSKAWQLFLSRRERRGNEVGPETISEEGSYTVLDDFDPRPRRSFNGIADSDVTDEEEDDKWTGDNHPIAQSLPIPIGPLGNQRQSFALTSYQAKTSLSDRPGVLVPALRSNSSSSSLRRASYAERDRVRPIDPGALDFAVDDDAADEDVESDPETGGKARQRALKILQARDEMPPAGKHARIFLVSDGIH
ncbi:hypothetical protein BV20DRAFT_1054266 [Pilatotrama ljubarskyi]|nr:hypothetical protein BV20DRAFT_1054266 [Pilatotrama ljubarskyi]